MFNAQRQPTSVSSRARTEAYAGLLLLLFAVTVLAFNRCTPPPTSSVLLSRARRPAARPLIATGDGSSKNGGVRGVTYGNAALDGKHTSGWWVGHFIKPADSLRHVESVETKWASHKAGAKHDGGKFSVNAVATSMAVLIAGKHRVEFADGASVILQFPGDYVIWAPGVAHSWTALEDSTMLCIRWPSLPNDQNYKRTNASISHGNANEELPQAVRVHVHPTGGKGVATPKSSRGNAAPKNASVTFPRFRAMNASDVNNNDISKGLSLSNSSRHHLNSSRRSNSTD